MQSVQNLGLAIVSQVAGIISDKYGYLYLELFFVICVSIALIASCLLYVLDAGSGGTLNLTRKERQAVEDREALEKSMHGKAE